LGPQLIFNHGGLELLREGREGGEGGREGGREGRMGECLSTRKEGRKEGREGGIEGGREGKHTRLYIPVAHSRQILAAPAAGAAAVAAAAADGGGLPSPLLLLPLHCMEAERRLDNHRHCCGKRRGREGGRKG